VTDRSIVPRLLAAVVTCVLAGCGGGGGSGGGGGGGVTVTANGTSFQLIGVVPRPSVSSSLQFTLSGGGSNTYYAEAVSQMSGLTAQLVTNGDGSATVTLADTADVNTTGVRTGSVTFKLCSDQNCAHVAWTHDYAVTSARFQVDATPLTLTGREGGTATATIAVTPPDTGNLLAGQATSNSALPGTWLTTSHDGAGNLLVTASGVGLHAGLSYTDTLSIGTPLASGALFIPVAFNVGLDMSVSALADVSERVDSTSASLQGSGSVAFAAAPGAWTATSDTAWLVVDTPAGNGAGTLRYHVDQAAADAVVGNWATATATIRLTSAGLSDATGTVTYRRQLPEIALIAPAQIQAGQAATVRVTGRGLSQLGAIGQIRVGGVAADGGTLDSDTQATLQLAARPAASVQVNIPNPLNVVTAQANLAVTAGSFTYAAVPTTDDKAGILYDPSRQAVYGLSYTGATLLRWKFDGTTWNVTALPWAGIVRVGMSPDRQTLFVVDNSSLSEVDPDTLATRATHVGLSPASTAPQEPLSITSDLRLWLPDTSSHYFDLRTRTLVATPPGTFVGGSDDLQATPDGLHMYGVEGRYSPAPPDNWYSAATQTSTALPGTTLQFNYRASFDLQGDLGLFNWDTLYHTGTWTLAGVATVPATESSYESVLSPDGKRIYRLAAPYSAYYFRPDHIDVFDTTQLQPGTSQFVQIGSIPVPTRASVCAAGAYSCDEEGRLQIDALGMTLFWVGNANFMVVPIPGTLSGALSAHSNAQRLLPSAAMSMRRR